MKRSLKTLTKFALAMTVALGLGLAASQAQAYRFGKGGKGFKFKKGRMARKLAFWTKKIGVSPAVAAKLKTIMLNRRKGMRPLRRQIRKLRRTIRQMMSSQGVSKAAVMNAVAKMNALKGKMKMKRALLKFRIGKLLTPAQLKKLKQLKRKFKRGRWGRKRWRGGHKKH